MLLVLDTSAVRAIGAGDVAPAGLREVRRDGVTICLADGTIAELTIRLLSGSLSWDHWTRARTALLETISRDEPVLPGGNIGLRRIGIRGAHPVPEDQIDEALEMYDAAWTLLVAANRIDDFRTMAIRLEDRGYAVALDQKSMQARYAELRRSWSAEFADFYGKAISAQPDVPDSLPARQDCPEALERCVSFVAANLDAGHQQPGPPPSVRLDAFLRVNALLTLRHLRKERRYNPEKNANDLIDTELLKYLAVPAAICTGDSKLIAKVRDSRSWQIRWIFRPNDLGQATARAEIKRLEWPK